MFVNVVFGYQGCIFDVRDLSDVKLTLMDSYWSHVYHICRLHALDVSDHLRVTGFASAVAPDSDQSSDA